MKATVGPTAESLMYGDATAKDNLVPARPLPDSMYDDTHVWQNANDRVSFQRDFFGGTYEQRTIAQAKLSSNPLTSNQEIRVNYDRSYVPPRFGYDDHQLTVTDVLNLDEFAETDGNHIADAHTTDFSGTVSGRESTGTPSLPLW